MRRLVYCLTLLTFIFATSPVAKESCRPLSVTSLGMTGRAAIPEDIITLPFDTPVSGVIPPLQSADCPLGPTQYAIHYPGGATRIKIEISDVSHPTFYVRFGQPVTFENGHVIADDVNTFSTRFYFPVTGSHLFEAGTYYIGLRSCTSAPVAYTFQARLIRPTTADTAEITNETSFGEIPAAASGSCTLGLTQYKITTPTSTPCGGLFTSVTARSDQNINLYIRRDQRVAIEGGQIVADIVSTAPRVFQNLSVPSGGTFFIAIGNCSQASADYTISLFQTSPDPFFDQPLVNGCQLERSPNGSFVLNIFGANIKAGATVTVGGLTPKKVQFVELEPGSTTTFKSIRVVKKFCGGLPGNIVITNPIQTCNSGPSTPFFCNERCPN
ncbi:MAG: hypothetical protein ACJ74J_19470 [Blastocatellia bacterium]